MSRSVVWFVRHIRRRRRIGLVGGRGLISGRTWSRILDFGLIMSDPHLHI